MTGTVVDVLRAARAGDLATARRGCSDAARPLLADALGTYLATHRDLHGSVYTDPAAFQAFIAGGGNVGLYEATAAALAAAHERSGARSVLDLGCGDGAALVPALARSAHRPRRVELVEPSAPLLSTATDRLRALGVEVVTNHVAAQSFTRGLADGDHWDLAEATFALHTLPAGERDAVLTALRPHVGELVVVEFDVPEDEPGTEAHLRFLADSYEQGLAEYGNDRDLVAQGFLVPVLLGQLDPAAARMTHEQPARRWVAQLERCGWTDVETAPLHPYWSSPAFLLTARGSR
ncbi:class I SAM-dependent methyltransferase [Rhodococcus aerolatus]